MYVYEYVFFLLLKVVGGRVLIELIEVTINLEHFRCLEKSLPKQIEQFFRKLLKNIFLFIENCI